LPAVLVPITPINDRSQRPETLTTTLPNGLRVASQETYGALCTFGIVVNAGR
ncbi:unnamed protein product, partial [Ectocarpus sp. 13 AM-2016]